MLHGQGRFQWTDGVVYAGEFQFNKITGEGTYTWPDDSTYTGQVLNSMRSGFGVFKQNGVTYEGYWSNGLRHGSGTLKHPSGTCYKGDFVNGYKQGKGRIDYPNGNFYEGEWLRDQKSGWGTMFWRTTNEKYTGRWSNNLQNGFGTHLWLEDRGEGKFLRNRYEGNWVNGYREGFGVFYYANGSKYEGEWKENLKHGFARFTDETGETKYCQFINDKNPQQQAILIENAKELVNMTASIPLLDSSRVVETEETKKEKEKDDTIQEKSLMIDVTESQRDPKGENGGESSPKSPSKSPNNLGDSMVKGRKKSKWKTESPIKNQKKAIVEPNPFYRLIDLGDLFKDLSENIAGFILKNATNMLLRHNPSLKRVYKFYAAIKIPGEEVSFDNELHFAMNFQRFWKMVRDMKIMTPKVSLGFINRTVMRGAKAQFGLSNEEGEMGRRLDLLKNNENYRCYNDEELVIFFSHYFLELCPLKNEKTLNFYTFAVLLLSYNLFFRL